LPARCCDELRIGDNTKAAILTRALAEVVRVGTALGGKSDTFYGLSGFGDLVATATGSWSRNRDFGQRLGEGARATDLISGRRTVVEGYQTTASFQGLSQERGMEAPILNEVQRILFEEKPPARALHDLMTRELKSECGRRVTPRC